MTKAKNIAPFPAFLSIVAVCFTLLVATCGANHSFADARDTRQERNILAQKTATQARDIVNGLASDRDKALAIAQWIAANWRNASLDPEIHASHDSRSMLKKFINRTGACGTRAQIFLLMAEAVGLKAGRYSIYNFGRVGGGHTAVQVFWDGKWHFFDVTYAGYFEKEGDILSFDEIAALGDEAVHYLVAFPNLAGDMYNSSQPPSKWRRVDNRERMTRVYAGQRLAKSAARGFDGQKQPVYLDFVMTPGAVLGDIDGSHQDVFAEARKRKISEQIERIGFTSVPFFQRVAFRQLTKGQGYAYTLTLADSRLPTGARFEATSDDCAITAGQTFAGGGGQWNIEFVAGQSTCQITISHNINQRGQHATVDQISFTPVPATAAGEQ